ncbi:hypothetical protein WS95_17650 [Burkholderia sp. MSMB1826]|nr:hypothetical protein WS95_17650 [Burkholderia sp. MSMB1826]
MKPQYAAGLPFADKQLQLADELLGGDRASGDFSKAAVVFHENGRKCPNSHCTTTREIVDCFEHRAVGRKDIGKGVKIYAELMTNRAIKFHFLGIASLNIELALHSTKKLKNGFFCPAGFLDERPNCYNGAARRFSVVIKIGEFQQSEAKRLSGDLMDIAPFLPQELLERTIPFITTAGAESTERDFECDVVGYAIGMQFIQRG